MHTHSICVKKSEPLSPARLNLSAREPKYAEDELYSDQAIINAGYREWVLEQLRQSCLKYGTTSVFLEDSK